MRKRLIKWLGGYTQEEIEECLNNSVKFGYRHAITTVKLRMQSCNGMDASEWCSSMWKYVINECKKLEQEVKP